MWATSMKPLPEAYLHAFAFLILIVIDCQFKILTFPFCSSFSFVLVGLFSLHKVRHEGLFSAGLERLFFFPPARWHQNCSGASAACPLKKVNWTKRSNSTPWISRIAPSNPTWGGKCSIPQMREVKRPSAFCCLSPEVTGWENSELLPCKDLIRRGEIHGLNKQ